MTNWVELSELLRNASLTMTSLVAIYVGLFGLRCWQAQKKWERKYEVASQVLESVRFYHGLLDELKEIVSLAQRLGEESDGVIREKIREQIDQKFAQIYSEKAHTDRQLFSNIVQAQLLFNLDILARTKSITEIMSTELAKADLEPLHESAKRIEPVNVRELITTLEVEITTELYES